VGGHRRFRAARRAEGPSRGRLLRALAGLTRMRAGRPLFAVTHCHSLQSSNRSSPMDAFIRTAVERVTGEPADDFDWSESLTTAEELAALLEVRDERSRIDLLFVTDHVNETFE